MGLARLILKAYPVHYCYRKVWMPRCQWQVTCALATNYILIVEFVYYDLIRHGDADATATATATATAIIVSFASIAANRTGETCLANESRASAHN
jgi:hypothetical protein